MLTSQNSTAFMHIGEVGMHAISTSDAQFLMNMRNDPSTWQYLETICPLSIEKQVKWIQSLESNTTAQYFILKKNNESIGLIRCTNLDYVHGTACIGVDIDKEHRGKGYSKVAYQLILDFIFNKINFHRVYLYVMSDNEVAKCLYEKLGFILEGACREAIMRNGVRQDYLLMGLLKSEYSG